VDHVEKHLPLIHVEKLLFILASVPLCAKRIIRFVLNAETSNGQCSMISKQDAVWVVFVAKRATASTNQKFGFIGIMKIHFTVV
jgi:hypothetical protein